MAKAINHFTHPNHILYRQHYKGKEYSCDGCKNLGSGTAYRCNECDFDLHEYCATCPYTLSSFMHPQHQLDLLIHMPEDTRQSNRRCDVCGDVVQHLYYMCSLCDFNLHPLCTQLPQSLRHVLHPNNPLMLQPFSSTLCMICKSECSSWRYRCGICCFDIHIECVLTSCYASTSFGFVGSKSVHHPKTPCGGYYHYGQQVPSFSGYPYAPPHSFNPYAYNMNHQHQQHHHPYTQPYGFSQHAYNTNYQHQQHHHPYTQPYGFSQHAYNTNHQHQQHHHPYAPPYGFNTYAYNTNHQHQQHHHYGNQGFVASLCNKMYKIVEQISIAVIADSLFGS